MSKSTIEPSDGSNTYDSMVGCIILTKLKTSEVSIRFQVDSILILGANDIDLSYLDIENQIFHVEYFIRVPATCGCVNGIRKSSSYQG